MNEQHNLIVLVGPTGVGKTELSLAIAEHLSTEIISADSRQLYRQLKIGTAAPTAEQLARVKHHLVGVLELTDYYSAAKYETEVVSLLESLFQKNNTYLLTGGSMMYVDALCKGIDDIPTVDKLTREILVKRHEEEGLDQLVGELKLLDPTYYDRVDLKNHKRVLHALEICYMTGKPYSSFLTQEHKQRPFNIIKVGLERDRQELYDRINLRVHQMLEDGLVEEVKQVIEYKDLNSLNTVGYKEIIQFLEGNWSLEFAIQKIQQNSRNYAKKQLTWFKRDPDIKWFHPGQDAAILEYIDSQLKIKQNID